MYKKIDIIDKDHLQRIKTERGKIRFLRKVQERNVFELNDEYYEKRRIKNKCINRMCIVCGQPAYCLHHIRPLSRGGKNKKANLIPICLECHKKIHPFMK